MIDERAWSWYYQYVLTWGDGGMVDAGDLKSPDRKVVRVRLPLAPLSLSILFSSHLTRSTEFPTDTPKSLFLAIFSKVS